MLKKFRQSAGVQLSRLMDGAEVVALLIGSGVSIVFGKLLAAALFGLLAAGVARRFFRRGAGMLPAKPLPLWVSVVSGVLAVVETAVVVEAIQLPVHFYQTGFEKSNLLLVLALLIVFYGLQRAFFQRMLSERSDSTALRK
jgi:ABC-type Na+ efflux pump permease subunit